jgi:hypothetical protein
VPYNIQHTREARQAFAPVREVADPWSVRCATRGREVSDTNSDGGCSSFEFEGRRDNWVDEMAELEAALALLLL